jgi:transcriptional regulator GlxA family with amidase domain
MMMRVDYMLRVICSFFAFMVFSVSPTIAQEFGPITFSCPPCGCSEDTAMHAQPGSCPVCGMVMTERSTLKNVAVFIYDGVQLLDFSGAYSVFEATRSFEVYTVAEGSSPIVTAFGALKITPRYSFEDCPTPDIFIIPGGSVGRQVRNPKVTQWITTHAQKATLVLSVCTGAFILSKTGLLDGLSATVLEEDIGQLRESAPRVRVIEGERFVDNGKYLSAAGPSSGMDASLHILTRIFGNDRRASAVARFLDYRWRE